MTLFELDPPAADVAEETAEYNDDPVVLEFIGLPHPQGSKSGVWNERLGRVLVLEGKSDQGRMKHEAWRAAVSVGCRQWLTRHPRPPYAEPVQVDIEFRFPLPASGTHRHRHTTKPDLDKLVRATFDAMVVGGLLADDARVCGLIARKRYARGTETAGASVTVWPLGADEQRDRERSKAAAREARRR
jgi:Holliday junction resolvase RusA-like endonuclease